MRSRYLWVLHGRGLFQRRYLARQWRLYRYVKPAQHVPISTAISASENRLHRCIYHTRPVAISPISAQRSVPSLARVVMDPSTSLPVVSVLSRLGQTAAHAGRALTGATQPACRPRNFSKSTLRQNKERHSSKQWQASVRIFAMRRRTPLCFYRLCVQAECCMKDLVVCRLHGTPPI